MRNILGQKFNRLLVIEKTDKRKNGQVVWKCKCDCGNIVELRSSHIIHDHAKSCGCFQKERRKKNYLKSLEVDYLIGQRFGRLLAVENTRKKKRTQVIIKCKCDCGNIIETYHNHLKNGNTKSCGCLQKEAIRDIAFIHGHARPKKKTPTYITWKAMRNRCYYPKIHNYNSYGGRGIIVCERWKNSFENFLEDMGERPEGTTLDRINPNGNYEPSNCRWATNEEQSKNKRKNM